MNRLALFFVALIFSIAGECGQPETGIVWPQRWRLESPVFSGELQLSITGSLLVEARGEGLLLAGSVKGRHIVFTRDTAQGREVWAGWLTNTPAESATSPFVAGTMTLQVGDEVSGPWGWYALPLAERNRPSTQPEAQISKTVNTVLADSTLPPPSPSPSPSPPPPAIAPESGEPLGFEGTWHSAKGKFVVTREGHKLMVEAPDGWVMRGRITGASSCIIGMGPGCCSGIIEGQNTIRWQDGSFWERR